MDGKHADVDIDFHRKRAATYDEGVAAEYAVYDALVMERFFSRLQPIPRRALDLGCGTGALTLWLARRGIDVEALDHSPDMLEVARRKANAAGLADRVTLRIGDIRSLEFDDGSFDLVTCQRVLHHVPEAGAVVAEAARVLRPGGVFYLSDSVDDSAVLVAALRRLWHGFDRRGPGDGEVDEFLVEHEVNRKPQELFSLLERNGFSYERRSYGHVGLRGRVPAGLRRGLIRLLSFPWRHGDMLFVLAVKQPAG